MSKIHSFQSKSMGQNPLVTIVTPSFNQAEFLEQTLHSVLAQDYHPVEYFVVDGGSTDGSQEIIERYRKRLSWCVSEPDAGQGDAINKGLSRAGGEIVAWINSDDVYLPGAISRAAAALQESPQLGMVFSDAVTINGRGNLLNILQFGDWGLNELVSFRIICQPAVFMRRSVLERAGFLDPSYHYLLDHHLWVRIARIAPIRHINSQIPGAHSLGAKQLAGIWAAARHHPQAKNVVKASDFGKEVFRLLTWMENQPDLAAIINKNRKQVYAGAYRLNGRYLLDGGMPDAALKSYWRALVADPGFTLKHMHRMIYAMVCIIGLEGIANPIIEHSRGNQARSDMMKAIDEWIEETTGNATESS